MAQINEKSFNSNRNSLILYNNNIKANNENFLNNNIKNDDVDTSSNASSEPSISKFDKYVYTALLCYANLTYGISLTCLSPALIDFTCILSAEAEIVTHYYTLFAIGTIIGSLFGFLFKYINRQLTFIITLALFGAVTAALPLSPDFLVFYLFGLIGGIGSGTLDIVQTVWLMEMWETKSGSILQLSEFTYGVGIICGSMLVKPFISSEDTCLNETLFQNSTNDFSAQLLPPFAISGSLQLLGAVLIGVMFLYSKYIPTSTEEEVDKIGKEIAEALRPIEKIYQRRYTVQLIEHEPDSRLNSFKRKNVIPRYSIQVTGNSRSNSQKALERPKFSTFPRKRAFSSFQDLDQDKTNKTAAKLPRKTVIGLGAVCFATIVVTEAAFIDFSPTFFLYYTPLSSAETATLLTVMTASYTLTRLLSILIAIRFRPEHILWVHYIIVFCGIIILFFSDDNTIVMWFGNVLFGIGIATFWSATFSHIESYYEITDRIGTIYVSALGLLEIATQFIEGPFLEKHPEVLLYYCAGASACSFIAFILIRIIVFRFAAKTSAESDNNFKINNLANISENKIVTTL